MQTETDNDNNKLEVDMKVEARYRGKSKYYPGTISRVRLNGTVDINYDDGERELGVKPELVRVLEDKRSSRSSSSRSPSRSRSSRDPEPRVGDKCEAQFKGKGKFYPGKISKVNSDGTVNVDFNDGDKDRYVDMKSAKLLDSGNISDASNSEMDSPSFSKGDKVECRYQRKSKYYAGTITKVHRDGTFDVSYDSPNKNKERNVNQKYIKARDDSPPSSPASSSRSTSPRSGRSKSPKKRKNKKSEDEMRRARIEKLEGKKSKSPSKRGRRRSPSPDSDSASSDSSSEPLHQDFVENDKVKCCYYRSSSSSYSKPKKQSKFLSAKIRRANRNSTYKVEFTSGDRATIDNVPAKYIKLSSQSPSRSPSPSRKRSKSWDNLLALANYHYDDSNRNGSRPSLVSAIKSSRGDDHKKLEKLIGRSNLDDYQDKFEQYDMGRNDELELEDVVEAFDSLGRRCSLKEVKVRMSRAHRDVHFRS